MAQTIIKPTIGECDACTNPVSGEVFKTKHGLLLCQTHYTAEMTAYTSSVSSNPVIVQSIQTDELITSKDAIFTAPTVSMMELHASIYQDESIPDGDKNKVLADIVAARIDRFKKEIFDDRNALREKENHLAMLQGNMQSLVGKLEEAERAKYKNYDVNYQPQPVKKVKSVASGNGKSKPSNTATDGMSPQAQARWGAGCPGK